MATVTERRPCPLVSACSATVLLAAVGLVAASAVLHRPLPPAGPRPVLVASVDGIEPNPGGVDYLPPDGAYFVATGGEEANEGRTIDTPLRTLGRALTLTQGGPGAS
jgi:hypothetical protein